MSASNDAQSMTVRRYTTTTTTTNNKQTNKKTHNITQMEGEPREGKAAGWA